MRSQFPGVGGCCTSPARMPVPDAHAKTLKGVLAWASGTETTTSCQDHVSPLVRWLEQLLSTTIYIISYSCIVIQQNVVKTLKKRSLRRKANEHYKIKSGTLMYSAMSATKANEKKGCFSGRELSRVRMRYFEYSQAVIPQHKVIKTYYNK